MSLGCRTGEMLRWGKKKPGTWHRFFSMAQWPFHGEKNGQFETPSLIHDGWDIETLSLIFNCPGPGTWTHLTYVD